ncbi:hypothetical protein [Helicobacter trogontum]|uniref:Uncharacterized protein n=1 Tax=Helicobacter trogontum TaxID=50960 RepID=A0A4U8TGL8_9HELI|nr:hypothetical protein [Helicobacter trogontum]MDY5185487.1 hypothetical protein [Helicobacter trogontum]TLD99320.1 hypothetical protein LS80_001360 [Helicobacter trogontum]
MVTDTKRKPEEAQVYYRSIESLCEAIKDLALTYGEISARNRKQTKDIKEVKDLFSEIENTIQKKGAEVYTWSRMEQAALKTLIQLVKTFVKTMNDSIANDEDTLIRQLTNHYKKCQDLILEIKSVSNRDSRILNVRSALLGLFG